MLLEAGLTRFQAVTSALEDASQLFEIHHGESFGSVLDFLFLKSVSCGIIHQTCTVSYY